MNSHDERRRVISLFRRVISRLRSTIAFVCVRVCARVCARACGSARRDSTQTATIAHLITNRLLQMLPTLRVQNPDKMSVV